MGSWIILLAGCGSGDACDEGELFRDGGCEPYVAGDPMPSVGWAPPPGTSWQWQLTGPIDTSLAVQMYDVDLFDVSDAVIDSLHADGRIVVCYFSAGSHEDWRDDAGEFPEAAIGKPLDGWPGERWLDVRDPIVRDVLGSRLDLAVARGCDAVEPDNVDGYDNGSGFPLTATEQLEFNRWLGDAARERGLSVGLKNDVAQLWDLVAWFDWALNEECYAYDECGKYSSFTGAGKAVFHTEYVDDWADARALGDEVCGRGPELSTLIKTWDLGPEWLGCSG